MPKKKPLKALIVIDHSDFDDDEFSQIRMKLMNSEIGLDVVSFSSSDARGKNGLRVKVDVTFIFFFLFF